MSFLNIFFGTGNSNVKRMDINALGEAMAGTPDSLLIDVRTPQEYGEGHIPGSVNLPLGAMGGIAELAPGHDSKLFVYCLSGGRSQRACGELAGMGYTDLIDLGGIASWRGPIEKGRKVRV